MRSKSSLFLLVVLGLGILAAVAYRTQKYTFGLDINGGSRLTYRLKTEQLKVENGASAESRNAAAVEAQSRVVTLLQTRASGLGGVSEPIVVAKGSDQVVVELPGVQDLAKAEQQIGSSARIEFYHARNVVGPQAPYRDYQAIGGKDPKDPTVSFVRRGSTEPIVYGTDAYKNVIKGWSLILSGPDLKQAKAEPAGDGFQPLMQFSPEGAQKMERWSKSYAGKEENLAAVLDGRVISLTYVSRDAVLSDNAVTQGTFETKYVQNLVGLLNSGALPVDIEKVSAETVDPSIGKTALDKMVFAGIVAFVLISVFMIAYYALPGFVAVLALGLYILFTLTVLKLFGATFSLAAIAGFILSVGMAVDANILVFERVREEIRHGKSLVTAIELGFRRALPAIIDSNACTILTSLVLVNVGTGPVKGFATSLIIGVAISLFTAVTVTRSLLLGVAGTPFGSNVKAYAVERNWFKGIEARADERPLKIVDKPMKWFLISLATMLIGIPFAIMGGFRFNAEFLGGTEATYALGNQAITGPQITANLERAGLKGTNVKLGQGATGERIAYITVPPTPQIERATDDAQRKTIIADAAGLSGAESRGYNQIGPTVQREVQLSAVQGLIISSLLIVVYLAFRFGFGFGGFRTGLRFAMSGILAMVHDIVVVISLAAIVGYFEGWEISALFLTAMLTIIGFSVHDTIVIFDRIRENLHSPKADDDLARLMDRSITQSFARSINTSGTVVLTLAILVAVGTATPELKFFVLAMLIGIVSGTYSSIYNASPILYLWDKAIGKRRGEEHTLVGLARTEITRAKQAAAGLKPNVVPGATTAAPGAASSNGRTYGQVKRRANQQKKPGWMELDD